MGLMSTRQDAAIGQKSELAVARYVCTVRCAVGGVQSASFDFIVIGACSARREATNGKLCFPSRISGMGGAGVACPGVHDARMRWSPAVRKITRHGRSRRKRGKRGGALFRFFE